MSDSGTLEVISQGKIGCANPVVEGLSAKVTNADNRQAEKTGNL